MSTLNLSLAKKIVQVSNGGSQLAEIENFEMQIIRDGQAFVIGKDKEGEDVKKFFQKNLHFKKMSNFTSQVNSLTRGFDNCEILAGEYKVKFKGGKFAINAERLLKEITENHFRSTQQIAIVDNESVEFEETRDKFVEAFIGNQTSVLNYLALIDTFKNASDSDLFKLAPHMGFNEDGSKLLFSETIANALTSQVSIIDKLRNAEDLKSAVIEALEDKNLSMKDHELILDTFKDVIKPLEISDNVENTAE